MCSPSERNIVKNLNLIYYCLSETKKRMSKRRHDMIGNPIDEDDNAGFSSIQTGDVDGVTTTEQTLKGFQNTIDMLVKNASSTDMSRKRAELQQIFPGFKPKSVQNEIQYAEISYKPNKPEYDPNNGGECRFELKSNSTSIELNNMILKFDAKVELIDSTTTGVSAYDTAKTTPVQGAWGKFIQKIKVQHLQGDIKTINNSTDGIHDYHTNELNKLSKIWHKRHGANYYYVNPYKYAQGDRSKTTTASDATNDHIAAQLQQNAENSNVLKGDWQEINLELALLDNWFVGNKLTPQSEVVITIQFASDWSKCFETIDNTIKPAAKNNYKLTFRNLELVYHHVRNSTMYTSKLNEGLEHMTALKLSSANRGFDKYLPLGVGVVGTDTLELSTLPQQPKWLELMMFKESDISHTNGFANTNVNNVIAHVKKITVANQSFAGGTYSYRQYDLSDPKIKRQLYENARAYYGGSVQNSYSTLMDRDLQVETFIVPPTFEEYWASGSKYSIVFDFREDKGLSGMTSKTLSNVGVTITVELKTALTVAMRLILRSWVESGFVKMLNSSTQQFEDVFYPLNKKN